MPSPCPCRGCKAAYEVGYREGYNDHARSRAYAEQVYGPYKPDLSKLESVGFWHEGTFYPFNQHGKGENP